MAKDKLSFKDALEQITSIVSKLDSDSCELEEMATLYEKGVILLQFCENKINDTKLKIEQINSSDYTKKTDSGLFFDNDAN